MKKILVLHGPNLNLLGTREPEVYGSTTLDDINLQLVDEAAASGYELECFQSNSEHELIEKIHLARKESVERIIINPGAFTHTSVALRDAILGVDIPFYEIHLSNVHSREPFRQHSYFSDIAIGVICGFGAHGYQFALAAAIKELAN